MQWFVAARLRRRLFFVFAAVIVATAMVASGVTALLGEPGGWRAQQSRVRQFVSSRFADAWTDPPARARLAADIARDLRFGVELRDARGGVLLEQPPPGVVARCGRPWLRAPVRDAAGALAGEVLLCGGPAHWGPGRTGMLVFAVLFVVWRMAGGIARRMARPFDDLVAVVRFDVEDRGPGIPDDERPRLFDPFFRGARGASGQGAGLGLALVRRIAEAHGRGVGAVNIPEGGARVGFSAACAPSAGAVASERA